MVLSLLTFLEGAPNPSICQSPKIRVVKIQVHQAKKKKKKIITNPKYSKILVIPKLKLSQLGYLRSKTSKDCTLIQENCHCIISNLLYY